MSLWGKVKKAAKKAANAAKKVAQAAATVVNTVTQAAADVVETAGNAIESGLNALADAAEKIPGVGKGIAAVARYVGKTVAAASDLAASAIQASGNVLGATVSGAILIAAGIATFDGSLIGQGFVGITAALAGGVILVTGKALAGVSALFPNVDQREELTAEQKKLLRRVFRDSLALHNIRLMKSKYGAGMLSPGDRPFTLGNVIYLKGRSVDKEPDLLVHEATHVWQYQNLGGQYTAEALHAQKFVPDAYNWERELTRGHDTWAQLNREAQASLLEDIYTHGELLTIPPQLWVVMSQTTVGRMAAGGGTYIPVSTGTVAPVPVPVPPPQRGNGTFYDADPPATAGRFRFNSADQNSPNDHSTLANDSVATVRNVTNLRLSGGLDE